MRPPDRETDGGSAPKVRRAAAIMFTDMVGYSALAQKDEALSIRLLAEQRKIVRAACGRFAGEEVKTIGDAFLVVFADEKQAVECALQIQKDMAARNARVLPAEKMLLRIGIHGGEILRSSNDVLGDNVNVAARIFPMAEPGGICISEAVFAKVEGRLGDAEVMSLGTAELKNVARMRLYAVMPARSERTTRVRVALRFASKQARWRRRALVAAIVLLVLAAWPFLSARRALLAVDRIAIADVTNETGEPYLDGLSGMLTTSLEQSRRLRVVTRSRVLDSLGRPATGRVDDLAAESFCRKEQVRVLVTSSIRRHGPEYGMTVRALDPIDGSVWFEIDEHDVPDAIPAMIDRLSSRIRLELFERALDVKQTEVRMADAATTNLEAYQHYFNGEQYLNSWDVGHAEAELKLATEIDPRFAMAWMQLAYTYWWNLDPRAKATLARAVDLKERIVTRREQGLLEVLEARVAQDDERAIAHLAALIVDYPADKGALFELADIRFHRSELPESIRLFEEVLALDPSHQRARDHIVWAYGASDHPNEMIRHAETYVARTPTSRAWMLLVDANVWLGRKDDAFDALRRFRVAFPSSTNQQGIAKIHFLLGDFEAGTAAAKDDPDPEVRRADLLFRGRVHEVLSGIDGKDASSPQRRAARAAVQAFHRPPSEARATGREMLRTGELQDPMGIQVVAACGRAGDVECASEAAAKQTGEALVLLAKFFAAREAGNLDAAREFLEEGRRKVQIRHQPYFLLEEAELALARGDAAGAEKSARRALEMRVWTPLHPLVVPRSREVLALALDAQSRAGEARVEWTALSRSLAGADAELPMAARVREALADRMR